MECVFCGIVSGQIPGQIIYRTDLVTAFRDINPIAPTHVLIVPNIHIDSIQELSPDERELSGQLLLGVKEVARLEGIDESGYRVIINTGSHGHQEVQHLHIHVVGGRPMHHKIG